MAMMMEEDGMSPAQTAATVCPTSQLTTDEGQTPGRASAELYHVSESVHETEAREDREPFYGMGASDGEASTI